MRRGASRLLKHRPASVATDVGSNRHLPEAVQAKAKDIFFKPEFPNKKVVHNWRFFIKSGKAATGPPIGQEFSKLGLKAMDFCKAFNDRTKPVFKEDIDLVCRVQVYFDKTYSWSVSPPPTSWFIMRAVRRKRRETGMTQQTGRFCCYMTLEMAYEVAKMKQYNWNNPEYPPIESRVRSVVGQARRMGIAVIGVDTHSSPVKGVTAAAYEKQAAAYRAEQWAQWEALKQTELDGAPLIERLHRPNLNGLKFDQLEEGIADPQMMHALWRATHPKSKYLRDMKEQDAALKLMRSKSWIGAGMSADEARALFLNWKLPSVERVRQLHGVESEEASAFWSRDKQ
jgi:ribosomal protein L11